MHICSYTFSSLAVTSEVVIKVRFCAAWFNIIMALCKFYFAFLLCFGDSSDGII